MGVVDLFEFEDEFLAGVLTQATAILPRFVSVVANPINFSFLIYAYFCQGTASM